MPKSNENTKNETDPAMLMTFSPLLCPLLGDYKATGFTACHIHQATELLASLSCKAGDKVDSLHKRGFPLAQLQHKRLDCGDEDGVVELDDVPRLADGQVRLGLSNDDGPENVCLGLWLLFVVLDDLLEADPSEMIHLNGGHISC